MLRGAERCPLCSSESVSAAFPGYERVVRCGACGVGWTVGGGEPPPTYDEGFFGGDYYTAYFARAGQWRHEARLRLRWLLGATRPSTLLEVGCGGGYFLEAARAAGIAVRGVEPAADGAEHARARLDLDVTTGRFEDVPLRGPFDAVCAFHVLEHVHDPAAFLAHARGLLAAGGLLALEVPNLDSARARRDRERWFNLVPDYHLWHFSPASLPRLVERAGFGAPQLDTAFPRHYLRLRRALSRSGLRALLADLRAAPTPHRTHPVAGDYLRLLATAV